MEESGGRNRAIEDRMLEPGVSSAAYNMTRLPQGGIPSPHRALTQKTRDKIGAREIKKQDKGCWI
jgi:hypothetical protein